MVKDNFSILGMTSNQVKRATNPFATASKKENKRKPISKGLRDIVWLKYMGNKMQGKCYCCKIKPIHNMDFQVGHNKSVYCGGTNHINNLRPICRSCNNAMGIKSIEWYKNKYYGKPTKKSKPIKKKSKAPKRIIQRDMFGNPIQRGGIFG